MAGITDIWTTFILQPMLNALLGLYSVLWAQFWLAIIVFTVVIRGLMTPLMLPQQRSAKKMQEIQPQLEELQKKYGKDREQMSQEQMKLYKEAGVNPMGGCLPMLVQFPIWIGLYQSIIQALGYQPLQLLGLSKNIYPFLAALWVRGTPESLFLGNGSGPDAPAVGRADLRATRPGGFHLLDPVQDDDNGRDRW